MEFLYLLPSIRLFVTTEAGSIFLSGQIMTSLSKLVSSPTSHPSAKISPAVAFTFFSMILSLQMTQPSKRTPFSTLIFSQKTEFLILQLAPMVTLSPITVLVSFVFFLMLILLPRRTVPMISTELSILLSPSS